MPLLSGPKTENGFQRPQNYYGKSPEMQKSHFVVTASVKVVWYVKRIAVLFFP
jgi:hypothetical protein